MQSERFTDFDEFSASVRGVDSRMMIQNPARYGWDINAAEVSGIRVQVGRLGSGNIIEGQSWTDGYLLYLPLSDTCAYSANGTPIRDGSLMILEPGSEFCLSTKFEHDWCSMFVPAQIFDRDRDKEDPSFADDKGICRLTRPDRHVANQFRASVLDTMATAANYPQFESSLASTIASAGLLKLGSSIVREGAGREPHQPGRPKAPRRDIIRRAQELLEDREGEHVSVADLAAASRVSERTLRTAFNECYGVGPLRYLQLRNLHEVHRALKAADPEETTVADTLLQHGEWELGRFASRYRRQFGELPSETLHAKH